MKITDKILSIPPFLSTSWKEVASLSMNDNVLIIELKNSKSVKVPDLPKSVSDSIFDMHAKYLEEVSTLDFSTSEELSIPPNSIPFKFGGIGISGLESMGSAMQHNAEQMNAPDLPKEILEKVMSIAKVLGMDDPNNLPKPEPHCNCVHCQIARALKNGISESAEEEVSDEDLKFRTWDIEQESDKLYLVINPLDKKERYTVFLGKPLGCTCGQNNCEHIKAVLNS